MARYEHLPIYKKAYDLVLLIEELVKGFSRYHKYGLGQDLRDASRAVFRRIVRANSAWEKQPDLQELRLELADLQLLARLCKDTRAFPSFKAFERVSILVQDVSRQCEGWLGSVTPQTS